MTDILGHLCSFVCYMSTCNQPQQQWLDNGRTEQQSNGQAARQNTALHCSHVRPVSRFVAGSPWLSASLLKQYASMAEHTQAAQLVPEALLQVKAAASHASCLSALQHLHQLCCQPQVSPCPTFAH